LRRATVSRFHQRRLAICHTRRKFGKIIGLAALHALVRQIEYRLGGPFRLECCGQRAGSAEHS
jgi:hypothetical protein